MQPKPPPVPDWASYTKKKSLWRKLISFAEAVLIAIIAYLLINTLWAFIKAYAMVFLYYLLFS